MKSYGGGLKEYKNRRIQEWKKRQNAEHGMWEQEAGGKLYGDLFTIDDSRKVTQTRYQQYYY
jgi:hypothetical protein